jgi:hypothetical protein
MEMAVQEQFTGGCPVLSSCHDEFVRHRKMEVV